MAQDIVNTVFIASSSCSIIKCELIVIYEHLRFMNVIYEYNLSSKLLFMSVIYYYTKHPLNTWAQHKGNTKTGLMKTMEKFRIS